MSPQQSKGHSKKYYYSTMDVLNNFKESIIRLFKPTPIDPSLWESLVPVMLGNKLPELEAMTGEDETRKRTVEEIAFEDEEGHARKKRKLWRPSLRLATVDSGPGIRFYQGRRGSPLYIRECILTCFDTIWKTVEKHRNDFVGNEKTMAFVVTGPPGLGKSWSSNIFVWLLLQRKQNIWFHSASDHKLTIFEFKEGGGSCPAISVKPESYVLSKRVPEFTWFLYDSIGGAGAAESGGMISFQAQLENRPCVVFSSPKDANYKRGVEVMHGFAGGGLVLRFWMPSWDWDELKAIMRALHKECGVGGDFDDFEDFVKSLYCLWGGIPRRFNRYFCQYYSEGKDSALEASRQDFDSEMSSLSNNLIDYGPLVNRDIFENASSSAESRDPSRRVAPPSWLVFPFPLESKTKVAFTERVYRFCSERAELEFFNYLGNAEVDVVRKFCRKVFEVRGAAGIAFERFAHFVLSRAEQNAFRWKSYGEENATLERLELPRCAMQKCDMKDDLQEFKEHVITCIQEGSSVVIEPSSDQQDAIDMFVVTCLDGNWRVLAMQDTIGKTHSFHPVKILEYRAAALEAFGDAGIQDVPDGFFLHVIVVPRENPSDPFRLLPASRPPKLTDWESVKAKGDALGLDIDFTGWNKTKAKRVCKRAKIKNCNDFPDEKVLATGAVILLTENAAEKVKAVTRVLDGFF